MVLIKYYEQGILFATLSTIFVILSVSEGSIASRFFVAEFTLSVTEGLLRMTEHQNFFSLAL